MIFLNGTIRHPRTLPRVLSKIFRATQMFSEVTHRLVTARRGSPPVGFTSCHARSTPAKPVETLALLE